MLGVRDVLLRRENISANPFVESAQAVIDPVPLVFLRRLWLLPLKKRRRALVYVSSGRSVLS